MTPSSWYLGITLNLGICYLKWGVLNVPLHVYNYIYISSTLQLDKPFQNNTTSQKDLSCYDSLFKNFVNIIHIKGHYFTRIRKKVLLVKGVTFVLVVKFHNLHKLTPNFYL